MAGRGRLLADEVNPPVAHEQEVGNGAGAVWCAVRCATKASRSDEALAVEVADVRRAVDGHGARDEVIMAPAEVVQGTGARSAGSG